MIRFIIRCAIAVAALTEDFKHVDVSVPAACVAGVAKETVSGENSCVYRNVSVRGHVMQHTFEVYGPTGVGFFAKDAMVVSPGDVAGFTWRSLVLLLIAVAIWIPSLLSLFTKRAMPAAAR